MNVKKSKIIVLSLLLCGPLVLGGCDSSSSSSSSSSFYYYYSNAVIYVEKTLSPCVLDKEKRRRHFIKSTLLLSVRIIHTHSINNKYVCHQFFFFNYSVPNPSKPTRVLFSMRVRWPTRVRFISISIDDDERRVYVAFYPRAKTLDSFYFSR